MDLNKTWKALEPVESQLAELKDLQTIKPTAMGHLTRMRKMVKYNMFWALLCSAFYLTIIVLFPNWQIRVAIGVAFAGTSWGAWSANRFYKSIGVDVSADNLLGELKRQAAAMQRWIYMQTMVSLFIYPILLCGAYLLGAAMGSGKDLNLVLAKPRMVYTMLACIFIGTPLSYFWGRFLSWQAFGKPLKKLNNYIANLSSAQ